jgi:tRNA threonylcarbamoyladenosine biosynthesis protein TsaE
MRELKTTISAEETEKIAQELLQELKANSVVALFGDLGSGKTTFVKGLASSKSVSSPTFAFLHIHPGTPTFYHFDLYRLTSAEDFIALGFQEYFYADGICCIEWPDKIPSLLPKETIRIYFQHAGGDKRTIAIER